MKLSKSFWLGGEGTGARWAAVIASLILGVIAIVVAIGSNKTAMLSYRAQVELDMRPILERDYRNRDPSAALAKGAIPYSLTNRGKSVAWDVQSNNYVSEHDTFTINASEDTTLMSSTHCVDFVPGKDRFLEIGSARLRGLREGYIHSLDGYRYKCPVVGSEGYHYITYFYLRSVYFDRRSEDLAISVPIGSTEKRYEGRVVPTRLEFRGDRFEAEVVNLGGE